MLTYYVYAPLLIRIDALLSSLREHFTTTSGHLKLILIESLSLILGIGFDVDQAGVAGEGAAG